jgi:hypothetical protein
MDNLGGQGARRARFHLLLVPLEERRLDHLVQANSPDSHLARRFDLAVLQL